MHNTFYYISIFSYVIKKFYFYVNHFDKSNNIDSQANQER
jgi:hypothetical protein